MDFWVLLGAPGLAADPWAALPRAWRRRYGVRRVPAVPMHSLALAAAALGVPAAALAAARLPEWAPQAQLWIATPYRAQLRAYPTARAHATPQTLAPAEREDIAQVLGPLMEPLDLMPVDLGGTLAIAADRVWDVEPPDFSHLRSEGLPNRPPAGRDARTWLRLHTEMEMALRARGLADGIWLWGGARLPCRVPTIRAWTNDPELGSLADARNARVAFVDLSLAQSLWPPRRPPRHILIAGAGEALEMDRRPLPWPRRPRPGTPHWPARLRALLVAA